MSDNKPVIMILLINCGQVALTTIEKAFKKVRQDVRALLSWPLRIEIKCQALETIDD